VFGGGAAGAGFEEAAAVHEGNDGEHLGAGADFEDGEEISQIVAEDVAGDADGIEAFDDAFEGELAGVGGGEHADVEAGGVVGGEVFFDLGDDFAVVGAGWIEPEDGGGVAEAGAVDGEFHPVLHGGVLGLAGAPDVALGNLVLQQHFGLRVES